MSDEDLNYDTEWDVAIGKRMKGLLIDGSVLGWSIDEFGEPHHEAVDLDGRHNIKLVNLDGFLGISGFYEPLKSVNDVLIFFSGYDSNSDIDVELDIDLWPCRYCAFVFRGSIGALKTFFKQHPPPLAEDYEDDTEDTEFQADYEAWMKSVHDKKTARSILGRGGREDNWQDRDEDMSMSFSVYNPKRKKRR